ncbi:hypothetical protein SAMN06269185_3265 [Natronoarchaeum philippinense]|uniref:Uncharacterized protein n=1 Tax=Natronoarchaeum philippinense TaxID=558529 RepID=A0A285P8V1_NATPI|nr:hypothetical protein [Natronoarchaeum philippinense]SNZ18154.1 hypothetical protein SAMN06269185_3265 [Natronoarchaeum philippinense]
MNDESDDAERCPGTNREGEPCGHPAGWGTDNDSGPCKFHGGAGGSGGAREGAGAPEGNTNGVTHGAYADHNSYYQDVLDDDLREFVDDVFADYLDRYRDLHGDPPLGIESELFRIAVTHAKDIGLDRWADEKPEGLESGHPLVDEETEIVPIGEGEIESQRRYRESVVLAAQKKLSNDRRMWLKDLGLLEDPDSQDAQAKEDVADALRDVLQ